MRSFTYGAALAAILVSTSLAGAYAASMPMAPDTSAPAAADQAQPVAPDMTTGTMTTPAPAMPTHTAMRHETLRPRLAHIDRQLGEANERIRVDHSRGYLTAAEYKTFQARSHEIRMEAQRTAANHEGALPRASYVAFQHRIQRLNREIHHAVTT